MDELQTPYYLINKQELDNNFLKLKSSLTEHWNNFIIGYSYKTNSLPWVIQYFNSNGCYSEVVSSDEYELGKKLNIPKDHFIYNGPIKTKESLIEAANNGCYINIDSKRELEWATEVKVPCKFGLRVNFDLEKYCPGQSQCDTEGGRFGFCYENGELEKAIRFLKKHNVSISGLHLHVSSKTRSVEIYESCAEVAVEIAKKYHLDLSFIDIGGGFFGGLPNKPQFSDYVKTISNVLKKKFSIEKTTLIVEPGMSVIGAPISYVCSVIDVKDTTYNRFVITDGSRTNIDPLFKKSEYFHHYKYKNESKKILKKQVICGFTCMENDRFFEEKNNYELETGDVVVFEKVGAYTLCLTPLFIKYFPDVYVLDQENIYCVRKKWTANEYISNSL